MQLSIDSRTLICLPPGRTLCLAGAAYLRVQVERGCLWLTEDRLDHLLAAGAGYSLRGRGKVVLETGDREPVILRLVANAADHAAHAPAGDQVPVRADRTRTAWAALRSWAARCLSAITRWRQARRNEVALLELSERTLHDIGAPEALCERSRSYQAEQALRRELERRQLAFWQQRW
jgi:uncharacterized protein YjiS (DUF1127 family)